MQIVIDIYDADYKDICELGYVPKEFSEDIADAIKNGTPLPKGHGRLIDADALKNEWKNGFHKKIVDALMDDALTIIEAESGETK